jgi:hypothetical protein
VQDGEASHLWVKETKGIQEAIRAELGDERMKEIRQQMVTQASRRVHSGTGGSEEMINGEAVGNLPVRNFHDGLFAEILLNRL